MVDPLTTSAISWGFSAASWLISPVLSRFLNQCFDALGTDLPPQFQSRKQTLLQNLEKLQTTLLPKLLILTDAAHQSPHRLYLEKWIQKLKSAFYEAEHVLGLVEYERLEKEVNSLFPCTSKFNFKNLIKKKLLKLSEEQNNLIESLKNLEKVVNEAMEFVSLLNLPSSGASNSTSGPYRVTISTPGSAVIGRDRDRDYIVQLLRENFSESSSNAKCYSVIGIWGMGGLGKTTLAQYVCEYEKEAMYFDLIIWAHVSKNFSVHAILKMIWESAFKEVCPSFNGLEGLQSRLEEKLRGQMFFLVLDDVWCDKRVSEEELEQLFAPLRSGKRGSKILVTTRIEEAAKALGAMNPIPLRELDEDQFFSLFMTNALANAQITDKHLNDELTSIGKKIAEKLHQSPLAAKTVAGQLRRRLNTEFWSSMLNRSLLNDTMGALFLSYQHLPFPLQRCFAFCSLYPKGHIFEHDHLLNLWIAEGFIEKEDSNEQIKDIANWYILDLVSYSFFQIFKWNDVDCYYMHDLIHDLAQHISQSECFKIENGEKKEVPNQTRHLSIVSYMLGEYVEKICKLEDLRTIVVSGWPLLSEVHLDTLFNKLSKLYVVELPHIESLTKSVLHLKNLRYIKIEKIEQANAIPESINKLYQLRVLRICWKNKLIPERFEHDQIAIPDVGRLISLQNLREFHVRKEKGFELKQLEHLTNLFGSLYIFGLQNVERKEDASQAKLFEKKGLQKLHFYWDKSEDVRRDYDVGILDCLCPPPQIEELVIKGYSGKRLPSWILEKNDNFIHLKRLQLFDCRGLQALQIINELSDLLYLTISDFPRLKSWIPLPLNLTQLEITHCVSLAFVLKEDLETVTSVKSKQISQIVTFANNCFIKYPYLGVNYHSRNVGEMINLGDHIDEQALSTISNDLKRCLEKSIELICQLKDIYGDLYLPPALKKLKIQSCFITDRVLAGSLQGCINSLTHLELWDIITVTCITYEVLSSLTSLKELQIIGCLLLTSLGGWDTHNNLEYLDIFCCPNLTLKTSVVANNCNLVELPSSSCMQTSSYALKRLKLTACMPSDDSFQNIVSLERLAFWDCPTVVNPHISNMKSLFHLGFRNCSNLISFRGLSEFSHLNKLDMIRCPKFEYDSEADKPTRLKELSINKFSQLEQLISRDGFSSLVSLSLFEAEEENFSQEECEVLCFLSSLESIDFNYCKIRVLPNLSDLHTLRSVFIGNCKNLTSLSELPPYVQSITICLCNEDFTKSCRDPRNPNWKKISHIPDKNI